MTFFDITPAGAFVNAAYASLEAERKAHKVQDNTQTISMSLRQMAIKESGHKATFSATFFNRVNEFLNSFKSQNVKTA